MSMYRYLAFVIGTALVAIVAAFATEFVLPMLDIARAQSTTAASAQGITWYSQTWNWLPLILLFLLVFSLIVAIVVRRQRVTV